MKDVSQGQGRTVLFVSHNMASVRALCERAILLKDGMVYQSGNTEETIKQYQEISFKSGPNKSLCVESEFHQPKDFVLHRAEILGFLPKKTSDSVTIQIVLSNLRIGSSFHINLFVFEKNAGIVFSAPSEPIKSNNKEKFSVQYEIPNNLLNEKDYFVKVAIVLDLSTTIYTTPDYILSFSPVAENSSLYWYGKHPGAVKPVIKSTIRQVYD